MAWNSQTALQVLLFRTFHDGIGRLYLRKRHRDLRILETTLTGEVDKLQEIAAGNDPCVLGWDERFLISNMLKIGHRLLGPEIGNEQGPLMTFMRLPATG